jgi:hypothetical protein
MLCTTAADSHEFLLALDLRGGRGGYLKLRWPVTPCCHSNGGWRGVFSRRVPGTARCSWLEPALLLVTDGTGRFNSSQLRFESVKDRIMLLGLELKYTRAALIWPAC